MAWVKHIRRVVHRIGEVLTETVERDAPPWPGGESHSLLNARERDRQWQAHLQRREQEAREEADLARQAQEQYLADLMTQIRAGGGASMPERAGVWLVGDEVVEYLMNPSQWRRQ